MKILNKKKNAFTLVELVAVLVIMAVIAIIATPLILTVINKAKASANKRSVDAYGKAVELSVLSYLMDNGDYPEDLTTLSVEYSGKEVTCNIMSLNTDGSIYLSECSVGGTEVKDTASDDGWYHYGKYDGTGSNDDGSGDNNSVIATGGARTLIEKANDVSVTSYEADTDESHEMYTFEHEATAQTEALTDYRYIGSDPYNYVTFNDEEWRIIGVFTVEDENGTQEQRIKIIRNEKLGNYAWDSNYVNEWSTASLNTYLNGDYYNSLSSEAQSMIALTKFYLGGSREYQGLGASEYYTFERGETVYDDTISTNWIGNIGLMYPSDYVYTYANGVDNTCYTDGIKCFDSNPSSGWLYNNDDQWTIAPYTGYEFSAFLVNFLGGISNSESFDVCEDYGVRSSLYLKSDIQIVEGNGSQDSPYQLKLN